MRIYKKTERKQLGGLPDLKALQGIDWSNYESVLGAGTSLVGDKFTQAVAQDDPSILENYFIGQLGINQSTASNPLPDPAQQQQLIQAQTQAYDAMKWQQANATGASMFSRNPGPSDAYNQHLIQQQNKANAAQTAQNTTAGQTITSDALTQFGGLNSLLSLLGTFQQGGSVQALGYSDNSPYKELPKIDIDGDTIDMSETGIPIKATPDKGKPKILEPYSGLHTFKGATKITETPHMKKGGKQKQYNYFQQGGQGAVGAQLEKDELIITPNMDIMSTAARLLHKDQEEKDKVTDVLGPKDYVISDVKKMKITRKQAEDIHFGLGGVLYEEGKIPDEPQELTAAKLFREGEDELPLTEYAKRIMKTFSIKDRDDVFSKKTNAANRESRLPYIGTVVAINEYKRTGGNPQTGFASTFENKFKTALTTDGNPIRKDGFQAKFPQEAPAPKMQLGGAISAGLQLASGIGQWIGAGQSYRDTKRFLEQDRGQINNLANTQSGYAGLATGAALAGYAAQDPYVEAPQYDPTQLDAMQRRVPRTLFDYTAARLAAGTGSYNDNLSRHARSFTEFANEARKGQAASLSGMAQLGAQELQQNISLENNYRGQRQSFNDRQTLADTTARNATRTNSNQLLAGTFSTVAGGTQGQGQIQSNRLNALRSNDAAMVQAKLDRRSARNQAFSNVANTVGQTALYGEEQGWFSAPRSQESVAMLPPVNAVNNNIQLPQQYSYNPNVIGPIQPNVPWMTGYVPPYNSQQVQNYGLQGYNPITGQYQ